MCNICFALKSKFSGIIFHDDNCPRYVDTTWADRPHA
jgi:hypothetical protein